MEITERKTNRLKNYNYSSPGAYFVTICTKNREKILSKISVGATIGRPTEVRLAKCGLIVDEAISNIPKIYPMISVDKYVIMPDHIHLIIQIHADEFGRAMPAPTIQTVIAQLKGYVTKKYGTPIWQKLFYDHIIRNKHDYEEISKYIDNNPAKWLYEGY